MTTRVTDALAYPAYRAAGWAYGWVSTVRIWLFDRETWHALRADEPEPPPRDVEL